jgi:hypothetical protein
MATENRDALIGQKNLVRSRIVQAQRQIERERLQQRPNPKNIRKLDEQLERLMAEESELRQKIDQTAAA